MISFIDNQTVKFSQEGSESCLCGGRNYSQLAQQLDTTEFQMLGQIANSNPSFNQDIGNWNQWEGIEIALSVSNPTNTECLFELTVTASGGSGSGYEYSIDLGAFSVDNVFENLCEGEYLIKVIDDAGNQMAVTAYVTQSVDCLTLSGSTANDLIEYKASSLLSCYANNLI